MLRRFSDFLGLHAKLADKHLPRGVIVPPAPEKSVIGIYLEMIYLRLETAVTCTCIYRGNILPLYDKAIILSNAMEDMVLFACQ